MKIVIAEVMHETNTFSNVPTTRELFELWEWARGDEIVSAHTGVRFVRDETGNVIRMAFHFRQLIKEQAKEACHESA